MDPGYADLLTQTQKYLTDAIDASKKKDAVMALKGAWDGLPPDMQEAIVKATFIVAAVGSVVVGVGKIVIAMDSIFSTAIY